jgi:DNA-binding MarR family transcriptional regulator
MPSAPANAVKDDKFPADDLRQIEKAVRRIVRAHDLQSKAMSKSSGVTLGQLAIMRGMAELGEVTSAALSAYADISAATMVTVLDNLEERGLVQRYRSGSDRRVVHTRLTPAGEKTVAEAPAPLGSTFSERFSALTLKERASLADALTRFAAMLAPASRAKDAKPES